MMNRNDMQINNSDRNTSYYRARVGKKPKIETSVFLDKAKKRQMTNYKLAMGLLFAFMFVFAAFILLGSWLNFWVVSDNEKEIAVEFDFNMFAPVPLANSGTMFTDAEPLAMATELPPQPVDIGEIFYNYNGVYLDVQKLESLEQLQFFIDNIKAKGINAINIDIKKEDGSVPYHINGQTDSVFGEESQIKINIEDIIKTLHGNELYVSGTVACFKDSLASTSFVNYSLRESSAAKMRWEDSDGSYWLNPYSEEARAYVKNIVADSVKLGFDEIILSWFFFPNVANENLVSYDDNGMTKYDLIKEFVTEQRFVLDEIAPNVKLGLNIPVKYFLDMPNDKMGLSPADLAERCNFFVTSFAPSDIPAGAKINGAAINNPASQPYETVKSLCAHFDYIIKSIIFRPYIQAFNGYGESQISNQQQALYEYDITVWQLVNFDNIY